MSMSGQWQAAKCQVASFKISSFRERFGLTSATASFYVARSEIKKKQVNLIFGKEIASIENFLTQWNKIWRVPTAFPRNKQLTTL